MKHLRDFEKIMNDSSLSVNRKFLRASDCANRIFYDTSASAAEQTLRALILTSRYYLVNWHQEDSYDHRLILSMYAKFVASPLESQQELARYEEWQGLKDGLEAYRQEQEKKRQHWEAPVTSDVDEVPRLGLPPVDYVAKVRAALEEPGGDQYGKLQTAWGYCDKILRDVNVTPTAKTLRALLIYTQSFEWFFSRFHPREEVITCAVKLVRQFLDNPLERPEELPRLASWKAFRDRLQQEVAKSESEIAAGQIDIWKLLSPYVGQPLPLDHLANVRALLNNPTATEDQKFEQIGIYARLIKPEANGFERQLESLIGFAFFFSSRNVPPQLWRSLIPVSVEAWRQFLASPVDDREELFQTPALQAIKRERDALEARWVADGTYEQGEVWSWHEQGWA